MARPFTTATTTAVVPPAVQVNNYQNTDFIGIHATNNTGAPYYVKLYWASQPGAFVAPTSTAATTLPAITIEVPVTGLNFHNNFPVTNQGSLYLVATSTAVGNTNTSLGLAGDVITVIYD